MNQNKYEKVEDKRPHTHKKACMGCKKTIEYWWTSGMSECFPHFYCENCGNPIWRMKDKLRIQELKDEIEIRKEINAILIELPKCICGGSFTLEAGSRCVHCGKEYVEEETLKNRIFNPYIMLLTGASMLIEDD